MITPMQSKLVPWYIAQARHQFVFWTTLPVQVNTWYWQTLANAYKA